MELADRMRAAIRAENPDAVIFANHSGNRTWYYPDAYMGEYPLRYSGAVDVSSVELYWDVPGDELYQPFVYAFMQAVTHDRGATVWIQPSEHGISGVSSPVEIQLRGLEGPPWGVYPEFVESTGREEYLKLHVENVKAREKWWVGFGADSLCGGAGFRPDADAVRRRGVAVLRLPRARSLPLADGGALAGAAPDRDGPGRRRPAGRARAGAAGRGLPVGPRRGSRSPVRPRRGWAGGQPRDLALRRGLPAPQGFRAWATCSGRGTSVPSRSPGGPRRCSSACKRTTRSWTTR